MIRNAYFIALAASFLTGCAITQTVKPIERFEGNQVCIVLNPAVSQKGFLEAYIRVLTEKGYAVKQLQAGSPITECPVTSSYTANWRWDLGLYMAYANIKVFKNGLLSGEAIYDSTKGGANMGKFIRGEAKITELVDQLFPGRAGTANRVLPPTDQPSTATSTSSTPAPSIRTADQPRSAPQPQSNRDEAVQLQKLKELRDKGLITEDEYEKKRKEILDRL